MSSRFREGVRPVDSLVFLSVCSHFYKQVQVGPTFRGKELYQEKETFSNQRGRLQKIRRTSENLQIVFWLQEKDKIPYRIMRASTSLLVGRIIGTILSLNFVCFWAFPIAFMGMTYKYMLSPVILPVYKMIDGNSTLRW